MQDLILKKKYFICGEFNKNDSVIIYTILFTLITRYFVWYNNKGNHPGTGNDTVKERLTLKKLDKKIDTSIEKLDKKIDASIEKLDNKLNASIERLDKKIDTSIEKLDKKLDASIERLDKKIDALAERLDAKIDKLTETVNLFIIEQRKFNQYVLDVFERNNLK